MPLSLIVTPTQRDQSASPDGNAAGRFNAEAAFAGLMQNTSKTFASGVSAQDRMTPEKTPRPQTSRHFERNEEGKHRERRDVRGGDECRKNDHSHRGGRRDQRSRLDEQSLRTRDHCAGEEAMVAMMDMAATISVPARHPFVNADGTAPSVAVVSLSNGMQAGSGALQTSEVNPLSQPVPAQNPGGEQKGASLAGMQPVMDDAELSIDLSPPGSATPSPREQAARPEVNTTAVRVSVAERKAPVTFMQAGGGVQTVAVLAGMPEDSDSGAFESGEQQNDGRSAQPTPERDRAGDSETGALPRQNQSFFGSVNTLLSALAGQKGVGSAGNMTAAVAASAEADASEEATPNPREGASHLTRGGGAGMEGGERVSPAGNTDFAQTLRGAGRDGTGQQTHPLRPIMQSSPDQVHVLVRKAFGEGAERITIQLRPASLGRIDVRIDIARDGKVTAHVLADRVETLDMMARDARALEQALKDAGLQADRDSLNFSRRGEEQPQAETDHHNNRHSGKNAAHANEEGIDELSAPASSGAAGLNADGSLDIRV